MSFFDWLTTGSSHGILLEQEKEPALSKPFLPFLSSVSLQTQPFSHGYDLSKPLSKAQRRARRETSVPKTGQLHQAEYRLFVC